MNNVVIKLSNVSKQYTIHHEKPTLVEKFIKGKDEVFTALNSINLTVKKGERVGIIGPNGSGKTTLLKIIAGITTPTSGHVFVNGKIVSLIDLEAGFHPDLTGYQNIFLNGMLTGMTKEEIQQNVSRIISFADIKQFIDTPLFTYSEGMKLRLGFAIAIHAKPNILILDEGLGMGDANFQKKAEKQIKKMLLSKTLTLFVSSHFKSVITSYCNHILIMRDGNITEEGPLTLAHKYFQT